MQFGLDSGACPGPRIESPGQAPIRGSAETMNLRYRVSGVTRFTE
jgi:hypothetical protein